MIDNAKEDILAGQPSLAPHRHWWQRRLFKVVASVAAVAIVLLAVAAEYAARHAEPLLRRAVVQAVEQRFHEPVELDNLSVSAVKGLQVRGEGLRILRDDHSVPPVVFVQSFTFHASLDDLLHLRTRVDTIHVDGLQIHIPPHSIHLHASPPHAPKSAIKLDWGKIICQNALLVVETDKPGKQPLQFDIHNLQVTNVPPTQPYLYQADVDIPRPAGSVHAFGHFGPWQGQEPRSTALDGDYRFDHADLSTIKGIGGMLTSTGHFAGQLGSITVDGTTDTPDFYIDISRHPVPLNTTFHAFVDGTSGDTTLAPVQAHLANSYLTAQGTVMHVRTSPGGHDIALTVNMQRGRIEDLLQVAMKTQPPMMRGAAQLQAHVHIPPGHESVSQKIQLAGTIRIAGVEFTNAHLQDRIDGLSMRAQGRPEEAKAASSDHQAEVASQLAADFTLAEATVKVSSLQYDLPGAHLHLVGVYSLDGNVFEFGGRVHTDAKASQMVAGWKSMLLKPLDGFLAGKSGSGVDLPLSINGVKGDYTFGFHDTHESADQMAAQLAAHAHPNKAEPH
jgi:hypothetical protein